LGRFLHRGEAKSPLGQSEAALASSLETSPPSSTLCCSAPLRRSLSSAAATGRAAPAAAAAALPLPTGAGGGMQGKVRRTSTGTYQPLLVWDQKRLPLGRHSSLQTAEATYDVAKLLVS